MRRVIASLDKRWQSAAHAEVCRTIISVLHRDESRPISDLLAWVPSFTGEVDLAGVIADSLGERRVYLPRVIGPGEMTFIRISADWASHLEKGELGAVQPREEYGIEIELSEVGRLAVLTPGIAFDLTGARIGRGGGYYDRFLHRIAELDVVKIGVCWSMQVVPQVPTDPHDVHMDWICHEREAIPVRHTMRHR